MQSLHLALRLDGVFSEPAFVHFQRIQDIAMRTVCVGGVRLHLRDVENAAIASDKCDGE